MEYSTDKSTNCSGFGPTNVTAQIRFTQSTPIFISGTISCLSILVGASLGLLSFARHPALRTSFNRFLISLLLADAHIAVGGILYVYTFHVEPAVLGKHYCTVQTHAVFSGLCTANVLHSMIACNRVWALFFPLHYRSHYKVSIAITMSVCAWILVQCIIIPWEVLNDLYYPYPEHIRNCGLNVETSPVFSTAYLALSVSSIILLCSLYPALWWKHRQRLKIRSGQLAHVAPCPDTENITLESMSRRRFSSFKFGVTQAQRRSTIASTRNGRRRVNSVTNFIVFTWIFFAALISWFPLLALTVLKAIFPPIAEAALRANATRWLAVWSVSGTFFEPWIIILTLPALRRAIATLFTSSH